MATDFTHINNVVFTIGRSTPDGVQLLGTCFLLSKDGLFATAAHVTGQDDTNLMIGFKVMNSVLDYQDTSDTQFKVFNAKIHAYDPIHDLCILSTDIKNTSNIKVASTDNLKVGDSITIFGYPHVDLGRMVLTQQITEFGARILINAGGIKNKHVVLNIQSRPGQSGSPIFSTLTGELIAILIGSYAPGGGGGISLGGVDPHTLHQTTHAISAEYLKGMF